MYSGNYFMHNQDKNRLTRKIRGTCRSCNRGFTRMISREFRMPLENESIFNRQTNLTLQLLKIVATILGDNECAETRSLYEQGIIYQHCKK